MAQEVLMANMVNLERLEKYGFWVILGMARAIWQSRSFSWAKFAPIILKGLINDVYKVQLVVAKVFKIGPL